MTPELITATGAIATILTKVGAWPVWLIVVAIILGPWLALLWISHANDKRAAAHDLAAAKNIAELKEIAKAGWLAYGDNVMLVNETQAVAKQAVALSGELAEIVHLNTQVQTRLVEKIDNNMFCPQVRKVAGQ